MSLASASTLRALLVLLLVSAVRSWGRQKSTSGDLQVSRASLISFAHIPHTTIPKPLGRPLVPIVEPHHRIFDTQLPMRDYTAARRAAVFAKQLRNLELTRKEEFVELIAKGFKKRKNGENFFTNNDQLPLPYNDLVPHTPQSLGTPTQNTILTPVPQLATITSVSRGTPSNMLRVGRGRIVYFARRPIGGGIEAVQMPRGLRPQLYTAPSAGGGWI